MAGLQEPRAHGVVEARRRDQLVRGVDVEEGNLAGVPGGRRAAASPWSRTTTLTSVSSLPVTMDRPVLSKITQYSSLRWPSTVVRGFTREPSSDGGHPAARRPAAAAPPPALKVCASRTASRNVSFGSETALPNRDEVGSLIPRRNVRGRGPGMRLAGPGADAASRKPLAARSRPAGVSDAARPTSLAICGPGPRAGTSPASPRMSARARARTGAVGAAAGRARWPRARTRPPRRRWAGSQYGGAKSEAPPRSDASRPDPEAREHRLVRLCRPWRVPTASVSASRVPAPRRPREPEHGSPGSDAHESRVGSKQPFTHDGDFVIFVRAIGHPGKPFPVHTSQEP